MRNSNITKKITQGMYVLTSQGGGCVVDAVSQISSGDKPLISVAVMKKNYTNELLHKNRTFALSVLGMKANPEIIKTFGFNSMREMNKFEKVKTNQVMGVPVIADSLGYMVCEIIDVIENDTHTLFIGELVDGDVYDDQEAMSYGYYQEHKEELMKVTTVKGKTAWICTLCGYVYYGETLPEDFKCPICGAGVDFFQKKD